MISDDDLKAIEGKVKAVNKPYSHHTTMQDAVIFGLLQTSVPALIADLRAAREALLKVKCAANIQHARLIAVKALGEE